MLNKLIYFINQREQARLAKGHKQEVELDPIIKDYFFTNVNKWDDRQSRTFLDRLERGGDVYVESLIFPLVHKEQYPTLPIERSKIVDLLEKGHLKKQSAYMPGGVGWLKQQLSVASFLKSRPKGFNYSEIWDIAGFGPFMVNQYISNIRKATHDRVYVDVFLPGAGTKLGYKLLTGEAYKCEEQIFKLRDELVAHQSLSPYVKDCFREDINNVGNVLCEFGKFCKIEKMLLDGTACKFRYYKS